MRHVEIVELQEAEPSAEFLALLPHVQTAKKRFVNNYVGAKLQEADDYGVSTFRQDKWTGVYDPTPDGELIEHEAAQEACELWDKKWAEFVAFWMTYERTSCAEYDTAEEYAFEALRGSVSFDEHRVDEWFVDICILARDAK